MTHRLSPSTEMATRGCPPCGFFLRGPLKYFLLPTPKGRIICGGNVILPDSLMWWHDGNCGGSINETLVRVFATPALSDMFRGQLPDLSGGWKSGLESDASPSLFKSTVALTRSTEYCHDTQCLARSPRD